MATRASKPVPLNPNAFRRPDGSVGGAGASVAATLRGAPDPVGDVAQGRVSLTEAISTLRHAQLANQQRERDEEAARRRERDELGGGGTPSKKGEPARPPVDIVRKLDLLQRINDAAGGMGGGGRGVDGSALDLPWPT